MKRFGLIHIAVDLAIEAFDLACQHVGRMVGGWLYRGDVMDSFSDPYVTRAPETDAELRARYNVSKKHVEVTK